MSFQPLDIEIQISSGWTISATEPQDMKIWIKKQKWQKQVLNQCRSLFSNMVMVLCLLQSAFDVDFMKWFLWYFMVLLVMFFSIVGIVGIVGVRRVYGMMQFHLPSLSPFSAS